MVGMRWRKPQTPATGVSPKAVGRDPDPGSWSSLLEMANPFVAEIHRHSSAPERRGRATCCSGTSEKENPRQITVHDEPQNRPSCGAKQGASLAEPFREPFRVFSCNFS